MCGILAAINSEKSIKELSESLNIMLHRGPDYQSEKYIDNVIYLGHNRLSIISAGRGMGMCPVYVSIRFLSIIFIDLDSRSTQN